MMMIIQTILLQTLSIKQVTGKRTLEQNFVIMHGRIVI